jgi:hypothetical protein
VKNMSTLNLLNDVALARLVFSGFFNDKRGCLRMKPCRCNQSRPACFLSCQGGYLGPNGGSRNVRNLMGAPGVVRSNGGFTVFGYRRAY